MLGVHSVSVKATGLLVERALSVGRFARGVPSTPSCHGEVVEKFEGSVCSQTVTDARLGQNIAGSGRVFL